MRQYVSEELTRDERSRFIKSLVNPRPIAWISTRSRDGVDNLAPFSAYNYVCSKHAVVMFSAGYRDGDELKDTPNNILEMEEFAVNVVTDDVARKMDQTSASLPRDESEFDFADVDRAECETIAASRVADAAATMECRLYDSVRIYTNLIIFGEVQYFHVSEDLLTDGKPDMNKINTIARLGGPYYTDAEHIDLERQY